jgi:hypothetical protein
VHSVKRALPSLPGMDLVGCFLHSATIFQLYYLIFDSHSNLVYGKRIVLVQLL